MEFLVAGIPRKGRGFTGMSIKVQAAVLSWDGATGQQRGWEGVGAQAGLELSLALEPAGFSGENGEREWGAPSP